MEEKHENNYRYTSDMDFKEKAGFYLDMVSGAFSLIQCLDYDQVCFEDLDKFCFGLVFSCRHEG